MSNSRVNGNGSSKKTCSATRGTRCWSRSSWRGWSCALGWCKNGFNSINRKTMLHNIFITCPIISTFISNCYLVPARRFVIGNKKRESKEGTPQGDPTAMGAYSLGVTPLLHFFHEFVLVNKQGCKELAFVDDFFVAGKIKEVKTYWKMIQQIDSLHGYLPKPAKSYSVVKEKQPDHAVKTFRGSEVNTTKQGKKSRKGNWKWSLQN